MGALRGFFSHKSFDYPHPPWSGDGIGPYGTHYDDDDDDDDDDDKEAGGEDLEDYDDED